MQNAIPGKLLATGFFFAYSLAAFAAAPTHPALRDELLQMHARDQEVREASTKGDFSKWAETDASNQKRLKEIVHQYGWPSNAMVGADGSKAAWLIAQHSDNDKDFQRTVLRLMEPLIKQDVESAKSYAYLYDRTHYPQRFGTQGSCVSREEWQPFDIEDIANVDQRRRELKMPSLADYAKLFTELCADPNVALHGASDPQRTVPVPGSKPATAP